MRKIVYTILLHSFLVTTVTSILLAFIVYSSTSWLEARQGTFLLVIATVCLCIINFILALPGFLNIRQNIRQNKFTSIFAFVGLPLALFVYLLFLFLTNIEDVSGSPLLMLGIPSTLTICTLTYYILKFRQQLYE